MNKDLRKLIRLAESQGFEASVTRKGHVEFRKDGVRVATFSGTPSDHRAWRNSLAALRRAGLRDR